MYFIRTVRRHSEHAKHRTYCTAVHRSDAGWVPHRRNTPHHLLITQTDFVRAKPHWALNPHTCSRTFPEMAARQRVSTFLLPVRFTAKFAGWRKNCAHLRFPHAFQHTGTKSDNVLPGHLRSFASSPPLPVWLRCHHALPRSVL